MIKINSNKIKVFFLLLLVLFLVALPISYSFAETPPDTDWMFPPDDGSGLDTGYGSDTGTDTYHLGGGSDGSTSLCVLAPHPNFKSLVNYITCIIAKSFIPFVLVLATVMFLWGVVQYVLGSQEEAERTKGRDFMIWGIIAITVMISVWGLVAILRNTFGIENVLPQLKQ